MAHDQGQTSDIEFTPEMIEAGDLFEFSKPTTVVVEVRSSLPFNGDMALFPYEERLTVGDRTCHRYLVKMDDLSFDV